MSYIYNLTDTWNAAGTVFNAIKMDVTNTASAAGSKLLSLQVASTEYFGVDKDGNVTIGNGGDLNISSATGGDASKIYNDAEDLYFATNGFTRMFINSSGNVGIGNTSPGTKLDVYGNVRLSAANATVELTSGGPQIYSTVANTLQLATGGGIGSPVERMRIDSSGNLLVGTTTTKNRLTVAAGSNTNAPTLGSAGGVAYFTNSDVAYGLNVGTSASDGHVWLQAQRTDGSATAYNITLNEAGGNVGIGTSSPVGKIDVRGAVSVGGTADASLHINTVYGGNGRLTQMSPESNSTNAFNIIAARDSGGSELWYSWGVDTSNQFRINQGVGFSANGMVLGNGYAWWNTTSTLDTVSYLPFQVKGGISIDTNTTNAATAMSFFNGQGSGTRVGWIGTGGSSTSYNTSSDERLKENIEDADPAGTVIDAIQVRKFDWKLNGEHQRYGMIAQELDLVFPEAVAHGPTEEDMMAVDYSKLVPILIKEIQSLRARVAQLEGN